MKLLVHMLSSGEQLSKKVNKNVELTFGEELPENPQYKILIAGRPPEKFLTASPNLSHLIIPFAGIPRSVRDMMREFPDISLHNIHHNASMTAEMAMSLLLSASKLIPSIDQDFRKQGWESPHRMTPSQVLAGKTALILGFGAIGQEISRMCQGFSLKVKVVRHKGKMEKKGEVELYGSEDLFALLPEADFLIICLPETEKTKGLLQQKELALLPSRATIVNVGRASVIDEKALYNVLANKKIHAAGLDVWYQYPGEEKVSLPAQCPFWELDNVVMSPHRAGRAKEAEEARVEHLARLLNLAAQNKPIPNLVDLFLGY